MLRIKFPTENPVGACLPFVGEEVGGSKEWHVWNITTYWNGKLDWLLGSMLPKIQIMWKKVSNKNYWESNFL